MKTTRDIVLLDGGMGRELKARGVRLSPRIWSASALLEAREVVVEAHAAFIAAGADVITTNNYAVVPAILGREGLEHRLEELTRLAVQLAKEAVRQSDREVRIAGSMPPLEITYRPDLVPAAEEALPVYRRIASLLAEECDLLLCETMSSGHEARNAARAAAETGRPVWVSFTLEDDASGRLRSGERVGEAVAVLDELPLQAVLLNCTPPESIVSTLPALRDATKLPVGAYANGFQPLRERWEMERFRDLRDNLGVEEYGRFARQWLEDGAHIVGGCCGIGPAHIAALREIISAWSPPA